MRYIKSSYFFKYFEQNKKGFYECKICKSRGIREIIENRAYHIRQQHRSIYDRARAKMEIKERYQ